ncbi:MAG TPA: hypothetical protein VD963_07335 [Phycisphaerales bacterium]|nr:hypothetical protein [Phycisphaerales bacterium]
MPDSRDVVELASAPPSAGPGASARRATFLRLWFRCSGHYARACRSRDGSAYLGRCPACGKQVTFPVGPGGTARRSFEVSCRG